jgi:hypothetical protein
MDATAMQLAQAFEDFIDTHKLGCEVDIAVYREAGADRQYNRTGHLSDFRQRQGERVCLFHVDGPGTGTETRRIAKALTQMCVQLRSLPTVILVRYSFSFAFLIVFSMVHAQLGLQVPMNCTAT